MKRLLLVLVLFLGGCALTWVANVEPKPECPGQAHYKEHLITEEAMRTDLIRALDKADKEEALKDF